MIANQHIKHTHAYDKNTLKAVWSSLRKRTRKKQRYNSKTQKKKKFSNVDKKFSFSFVQYYLWYVRNWSKFSIDCGLSLFYNSWNIIVIISRRPSVCFHLCHFSHARQLKTTNWVSLLLVEWCSWCARCSMECHTFELARSWHKILIHTTLLNTLLQD